MKKLPIEAVYINLDDKTERRQGMQAKLEKCFDSSQFRRQAACLGDDRASKITRAELGCFLSHQQAIQGASGEAFTLVLEDDVVFPEHFSEHLQQILTHVERNIADWDVLFLSQMTDIGNFLATYRLLQMHRELKSTQAGRQFRVVECKSFYASCAASYVVNPRSRNKLLAILGRYASQNYPAAIDICYLKEINENKLSCHFVFPYLTGLESGADSAIQIAERAKTSQLMEDMLNLLYVEGDPHMLMEKYESDQGLKQSNTTEYVASQIIFNRFTY